jgi:succinylarginine dihydrolase
MARSARSISTGSSGRATIMPGSASATSPRRATPARCRSRAPRRCRASTRCAPTSRSAWPRAFSCRSRAPRAWLAELGRHRGGRAGARRQCDVGLGDVGGQCRDGRPAPDTADGRCHLTVANLKTMPHRSHEWPATLAQLRLAFADERLRGPRPGPAGVRRRGRGQSHAAGPARTASRASSVRLWRLGRRLPGPPASRSVEGDRPAAPARSRADHLRRAIRGSDRRRRVPQRRRRGRQRAVLFAHEKAFADRDALSPSCERLVPGFELVEVPDAEVPLADAIQDPICSTPSW